MVAARFRTRATCRARPASPRSGRTARRASPRARAAARSVDRPRPSRCPTCSAPRTGRAAAARPRAASAAIRARGSTDSADAVEVDPAASCATARPIAARPCLRALRLARMARRRLPSRTTSVVCVGGERRSCPALSMQRFGAQRREIEELEAARRLLVPAAPVRAGDRQHASRRPCRPRRRSGRSVLGDRKRGDAARDAVEIDAHARAPSRRPCRPCAAVLVGFRPLGSGSNGGRWPLCSAIR